MTTIRASEVGRLLACHQSIRGDIRIDRQSDAADQGSAVHRALAKITRSSPIEERRSSVDYWAITADYGVEDFKDFAYLVNSGRKFWRKILQPICTVPHVEEFLSVLIAPNITLTGHPDLYWTHDAAGVILDWKSDREPDKFDHTAQLKSYALNVCLKHNLQNAKTITYYLRWQEKDIKEYSLEELLKFKDEIVEAVNDSNPQFKTGRHCTFCKKADICEALTLQLRQQFLVLTGEEVPDIRGNPEKIMPTIKVGKALVKVVSRFNQQVNDEISRNGPIDLPDGSQIVHVPVTWEVIDYTAGREVLEEHLDGDLSGVVKVSKTRALEAVGAKAKLAGDKIGQAKAEFITDLSKAGAIRKEPQKPRIKLIPKPKEEIENGK